MGKYEEPAPIPECADYAVQQSVGVVLSVDEKGTQDDINRFMAIMGDLDGELSMHNATTMVEVPE